MSDIVVSAEAREQRGKNEAKRLRVRGRIPAIVYAPGKENVAVSVSPRELAAVFKTGAAENTLVDLELDGKKRKVILKEYQVHPVKPEFLHADFYEVALDKPIHVRVHIELQGVPVGVKTHGGMLEFVTREIMVACLPLDIPKKFVIDISALEIDGEVRVAAVPVPPKVKILTDGDLLVAHVVTKHEEEAAATPVEGAVVAAEPEVAKKGKAPTEAEAAAAKAAPGKAAPAAPAGKDVKKDKK
ncbi:MAG: 50S ribosomal protein L25 [Vicinamibacteria bacterium]